VGAGSQEYPSAHQVRFVVEDELTLVTFQHLHLRMSAARRIMSRHRTYLRAAYAVFSSLRPSLTLCTSVRCTSLGV
jgi:hypothetical protein